MRHIEVLAFGAPPCNGLIVEERPSAPPPSARAPSRPVSLPVLGVPPRSPEAAPHSWRCQGCGRCWEREPLPDEAL